VDTRHKILIAECLSKINVLIGLRERLKEEGLVGTSVSSSYTACSTVIQQGYLISRDFV